MINSNHLFNDHIINAYIVMTYLQRLNKCI